jgi:NAD(P)-dependent dehydrogenase (short-subunit alcohol dehydrogenase family)
MTPQRRCPCGLLTLCAHVDGKSVQAAVAAIGAAAGHLDVLVNSAGISGNRTLPGDLTAADLETVYRTNVFGVVRVTQAFLPLLEASGAPIIVNVSSGLGSMTFTRDPQRMESTFLALAYPSSNAALNMLTSLYSKAYPAMRINAVDPATPRPTSTATAARRAWPRERRSSSGWPASGPTTLPAGTSPGTAPCPGK